MATALGAIPAMTQEQRDKEALLAAGSGVATGAQKLTAAAADIFTLPARGVMGVANTALRAPNAFGAGIPYIPEAAFGGSSSSLTPYYDSVAPPVAPVTAVPAAVAPTPARQPAIAPAAPIAPAAVQAGAVPAITPAPGGITTSTGNRGQRVVTVQGAAVNPAQGPFATEAENRQFNWLAKNTGDMAFSTNNNAAYQAMTRTAPSAQDVIMSKIGEIERDPAYANQSVSKLNAISGLLQTIAQGQSQAGGEQIRAGAQLSTAAMTNQTQRDIEASRARLDRTKPMLVPGQVQANPNDPLSPYYTSPAGSGVLRFDESGNPVYTSLSGIGAVAGAKKPPVLMDGQTGTMLNKNGVRVPSVVKNGLSVPQ